MPNVKFEYIMYPKHSLTQYIEQGAGFEDKDTAIRCAEQALLDNKRGVFTDIYEVTYRKYRGNNWKEICRQRVASQMKSSQNIVTTNYY